MEGKAKGREVILKQAAGAAPYTLLYCPSCTNRLAGSYEQDFSFNWSLKLKCDLCTTSWWVCQECSDQRAHLKTRSQAARHNRVKHKSSTTRNEPNMKTAPTPQSGRSQPTFPHMSTKNSKTFFAEEVHGKGQIHLIATALGQQASTIDILKEDVDMMMTLCHFVTTLTRPQRENLATVLEQTTKCTIRQFHSVKNAKYFTVPVPTTKQQIRSIICEGQKSILNNLPSPSILTAAEHAYLLPSECVADFLAHGLTGEDVSANSINPVESLVESATAKSIQEKHPDSECIFLSLWSDDFEPNYAKGNRGSVWLCTLTIQSTNCHNITLKNVYPIAIGPKSADHRSVVRIIVNNINSLKSKTSMYNGRVKTEQEITVHLLCLTQDQPERRGFNSLLIGGKGHHARWGWSLNMQKVTGQIPPCNACLDRMKTSIIQERPSVEACADCANFLEMPQFAFTAPEKDYPLEELREGVTECKKLSYNLLKECVDKTHKAIVEERWSKATAKSYMSCHCLNTQAQDEIVECATNCQIFARAERDNDQEILTACHELRDSEPEKHQIWAYPAIWDAGISIQQSTEACMHLLFLGITKNVIFEIQSWAALRNKYTSLRRQLELVTSRVEALHLSWAKVQPYRGEKLGGWVSENFLGFSRIMPWAYSAIEALQDDTIIPPPLNKPVLTWTIKECKLFLVPRRLPVTGNVKELRQLVSQNWNLEIPPPSGGPAVQVRALILSLWQMLAYLMGMTKTVEALQDISPQLIRLFLNYLSVHDASICDVPGTNRKNPIWMSQYNCMCLLNLPEQIQMLGPIRNRWEGGKRGEGFLRAVKPIVQSGRKNWQTNLLKNILRQKTLLQLGQMELVEDSDDDEDEETVQIHEPQSFVIYATQAELLSDWNTGKPLSGLAVGKQFFCCYRRSGQKLLHQFNPILDTKQYHFGMWYVSLGQPQAAVEMVPAMSLAEITASRYVALLPMHSNEFPPNGVGKYTAIASDWRSWDSDLDFVLPHQFLSIDLSLDRGG